MDYYHYFAGGARGQGRTGTRARGEQDHVEPGEREDIPTGVGTQVSSRGDERTAGEDQREECQNSPDGKGSVGLNVSHQTVKSLSMGRNRFIGVTSAHTDFKGFFL